MVRAVVVVALLASACRFDADHGGTTYRCDDQPICPDGFTCQGGFCRAELLDAALYCRALDETEVAQNFAAGPG